MANVANTAANLSGDTLLTAENSETKTGLLTFDRGAATAPFAVAQATAAKVTNLDADKLDGIEGAALVKHDGTVAMTGKLDLGTVGQLQFPASQSASGDANCLDDYEEGSWTPALAFGGSASGITYTTQTGRYTKIGRLVFLECRIVLTSNGSGTGSATITGAPFNPGIAATAGVIDPIANFSGLTAGGAIFAVMDTSGTIYPMVQSTTTRAQLTETNITDTAQFSFTLFYTV
jgi:hypothetical protein